MTPPPTMTTSARSAIVSATRRRSRSRSRPSWKVPSGPRSYSRMIADGPEPDALRRPGSRARWRPTGRWSGDGGRGPRTASGPPSGSRRCRGRGPGTPSRGTGRCRRAGSRDRSPRRPGCCRRRCRRPRSTKTDRVVVAGEPVVGDIDAGFATAPTSGPPTGRPGSRAGGRRSPGVGGRSRTRAPDQEPGRGGRPRRGPACGTQVARAAGRPGVVVQAARPAAVRPVAPRLGRRRPSPARPARAYSSRAERGAGGGSHRSRRRRRRDITLPRASRRRPRCWRGPSDRAPGAGPRTSPDRPSSAGGSVRSTRASGKSAVGRAERRVELGRDAGRAPRGRR